MFTLMFNNRTYSKCIEHSQIKQCRHLILVFSFVVVFDFVIFISRFGRYFCNSFCRMVSNVNCPFNYERRRMSRFFFIPRMIYYLPFEFESIIDLFNILIFKTKIYFLTVYVFWQPQNVAKNVIVKTIIQCMPFYHCRPLFYAMITFFTLL